MCLENTQADVKFGHSRITFGRVMPLGLRKILIMGHKNTQFRYGSIWIIFSNVMHLALMYLGVRQFLTSFILRTGVAQSVKHWTANLATRVRSPVGEEPFHLICAFLHVQMEPNWAGLSVRNCRHTGKWCGTLKAVGNTDHTRQTWIHMQTPLSPLAECGPVGEGTSGNVLNWTVRSLNHAYTTPPSFIF